MEWGAQHDFLLFYSKQIELLTKSAWQVTKKKHFNALMEYYNQQLFPGDEEDPLENLLDEEWKLLKAIDSEGEDNVSEDGSTEMHNVAQSEVRGLR